MGNFTGRCPSTDANRFRPSSSVSVNMSHLFAVDFTQVNRLNFWITQKILSFFFRSIKKNCGVEGGVSDGRQTNWSVLCVGCSTFGLRENRSGSSSAVGEQRARRRDWCCTRVGRFLFPSTKAPPHAKDHLLFPSLLLPNLTQPTLQLRWPPFRRAAHGSSSVVISFCCALMFAWHSFSFFSSLLISFLSLFRFFFLPYSFFFWVVVCTVIIVIITIIPFLLTFSSASSSSSGLRAFASGPAPLPAIIFPRLLRVWKAARKEHTGAVCSRQETGKDKRLFSFYYSSSYIPPTTFYKSLSLRRRKQPKTKKPKIK